MGKKRPNAAQKRLAHVRALRDEYFSEEPTLEEQLAMKDARIAQLELELDVLRAKLRRQRPKPDVG